MQSPFAGSLQILIDPVSLELLETQQAMSGWVRFFHDLHGHIFIAGGLGREIVGWLGVAMLVLGCSGLYLWWPKSGQWKAAFTVRRTAKGIRFNRELHGAVGIWSLVLFMVVNFTGVYLAFPQQISAAVNTVWPGRDMRAAQFQARVEPMRGATAIGLDEALALARERVPDARFLNAFLPTRPDQALRIGMIRQGHGEGAPAITVIIDPWRKSHRRRVRSQDALDRRIDHRLAARAALRPGAGRRLQVPGLRVGRDHPGLRRHRLPDVVAEAPQPARRRTGQGRDPRRSVGRLTGQSAAQPADWRVNRLIDRAARRRASAAVALRW